MEKIFGRKEEQKLLICVLGSREAELVAVYEDGGRQGKGQINKLKTIKRQMYGQASFDLLRKRLLLDSS